MSNWSQNQVFFGLNPLCKTHITFIVGLVHIYLRFGNGTSGKCCHDLFGNIVVAAKLLFDETER